MPNYRVRNLSPETPVTERQRLQAALCKLAGVRTVVILPVKREFRITFTGKEPSFTALKEACESAGFMLHRKS